MNHVPSRHQVRDAWVAVRIEKFPWGRLHESIVERWLICVIRSDEGPHTAPFSGAIWPLVQKKLVVQKERVVQPGPAIRW
ncbi:MAG: hypothetical protein ACPGLY_09530 [Rubripirellula sp.]